MIEQLIDWGYTEREASFLLLAALHGGYFLRRQYVTFSGLDRETRGGTPDRLVKKLESQRHARRLRSCTSAQIYHLDSRPFYAAIGEEDNRNRRLKTPMSIRQKLMMLDFVLDHPTTQFLATEATKVAYFTGRGIPVETLPSKIYIGDQTGSRTTRYFVDKQPIYEDAGAPQLVYVDEGGQSTAGFETWLSRCDRMLSCLSAFAVVYCAANAHPMSAARALFNCKYGPRLLDLANPTLLQYFEDLAAYEAKNWGKLGKAGIDRYQACRHRFNTPEIRQQYERWKFSTDQTSARPYESSGQFKPYLLQHSYDLFGSAARVRCA